MNFELENKVALVTGGIQKYWKRNCIKLSFRKSKYCFHL